MGRHCKSRGRAKDLRVDGGVIQGHIWRYARLNPETLANYANQIFTLSIFLGTGSDKRDDLLRQTGEVGGHGIKGEGEGEKEGEEAEEKPRWLPAAK